MKAIGSMTSGCRITLKRESEEKMMAALRVFPAREYVTKERTAEGEDRGQIVVHFTDTRRCMYH